MHFKVHVPDKIDFKLEIEIEDDERELEIELKWCAKLTLPAPGEQPTSRARLQARGSNPASEFGGNPEVSREIVRSA